MIFGKGELKKSHSQSDLIEKRDSVELESLDLQFPQGVTRKWHILPALSLICSILALAAWTILVYKQPHTALSPSKIEDEIFKTTMRVVSETEAVFKEVRQQADIMCEKNRKAALQYVTEIRDTMKDRTKIGVEKVNQVVEENLSNIRVELQALETTTKDIFNGLVDILQSDLNETMNTLSSADDQNLTYALNNALNQAEYEVHTMWNDIDQMYSFYSDYSTDLIQKKAGNMTDRINGLVASQRRYCDCTLYNRVSMCYNISLANIETSKTIEKLVHTLNNIYNTTNSIEKLHYMHYEDSAVTVFNDSTSLLSKYKNSTQEIIEKLLTDHACFLGSAVRYATESTYPHIKRFILRSWKSAIQNASTGLNATLTVDPLIKEEYRYRIIDDARESLQKLGTLIKNKASLVPDEATRNRFIEKADFVELEDLMEDRFKNVTEVINNNYLTDLWCAAETTRYNVEFIVEQKVPFISSISIQNYLPTDVCPLAMDFSNFMYRFLNSDLYSDTGNDMLDYLLPEHGQVVVDDATQFDDTSAEGAEYHISVLIGDDSNEKESPDDTPSENIAFALVDTDTINDQPVVEPKPFLGNESTGYDVEPRPLDYKETPDDVSENPPTDGIQKQAQFTIYMTDRSPEETEANYATTQSFTSLPVLEEPLVELNPAMNSEPFDSEDEHKFSPVVASSPEENSLSMTEEFSENMEGTTKLVVTNEDGVVSVTSEILNEEIPTSKIEDEDSIKPTLQGTAILAEEASDEDAAVGMNPEMEKPVMVKSEVPQNSAEKSSEEDGVLSQSFLADEVASAGNSQESGEPKKKFVEAVNKVEKMIDAVEGMGGKIDRR